MKVRPPRARFAMSGRQSAATEVAVRLVARGYTLTLAANKAGVAISTLRRALRRAGEPPRKPGKPKT